jgi:hypothetical protein
MHRYIYCTMPWASSASKNRKVLIRLHACQSKAEEFNLRVFQRSATIDTGIPLAFAREFLGLAGDFLLPRKLKSISIASRLEAASPPCSSFQRSLLQPYVYTSRMFSSKLLFSACCIASLIANADSFGLGFIPGATKLSNSRLINSLQARARTSVWRPNLKNRGVTMQVWSNEQAIQEYKDLLAGKVAKPTEDGPSVIIGGGRLGMALKVNQFYAWPTAGFSHHAATAMDYGHCHLPFLSLQACRHRTYVYAQIHACMHTCMTFSTGFLAHIAHITRTTQRRHPQDSSKRLHLRTHTYIYTYASSGHG